MGDVYVFNGTRDQIVLAISPCAGITNVIPPVPGPGHGIAPWTPYQIQVGRTDDPPQGTVFVNGEPNGVTVQTPNGNWPEAELPIPGAPTSTADLWLYVFYQRLFLIDTNGWLRAQWPPTSEAGEVALSP
jgi:hypothetical protein